MFILSTFTSYIGVTKNKNFKLGFFPNIQILTLRLLSLFSNIFYVLYAAVNNLKIFCNLIDSPTFNRLSYF